MAYAMEPAGPLGVTDRPDEQVAPVAQGMPQLPLSGAERPGLRPDPAAVSAALRSVLDDQLLDQMVAKIRTEGVRLTGPGGFLTELLKAVLERGLAAELTEHLGYDKHDPAGRGTGNSRNGTHTQDAADRGGAGAGGGAAGPGRHVHPPWCPRANGGWAGCPTSSSASTPAG
jgi:hypothetical protein